MRRKTPALIAGGAVRELIVCARFVKLLVAVRFVKSLVAGGSGRMRAEPFSLL
jgi:hypothetical protein